MMPLSDDRILVLDLREGSASAFNEIYSLYHKRIYNFCLHLYQPPDEARETVQKVFVALWEQRLKLDENQSLAAYLYSIARHIVYQEFRQQVYKSAACKYFLLNSDDLNDSTNDCVLYNELQTFFESEIEELPVRQREIFRLNRFSGLTYRQIAAKLNITENTVDTQIRRALDFLRAKYKFHYH